MLDKYLGWSLFSQDFHSWIIHYVTFLFIKPEFREGRGNFPKLCTASHMSPHLMKSSAIVDAINKDSFTILHEQPLSWQRKAFK